MNREELTRLSWAVKTAPQCAEGCPGHLPNGLCVCGAMAHRLDAQRAFRCAVAPDVVLALVETMPNQD